MLRKKVKLILEQLQVFIFAEIVFGVRCTLRAEWTQQFQQGEIDLHKHFLLQPSESSFESMQWIGDNLPLHLMRFICGIKCFGELHNYNI